MLKRRLKLSGLTALSSFLALAILMMATRPLDNLIFTALFFVLSLLFLTSLGFFIVRLQTKEVSPKNRYRVVAISLLVIILVMFRSAKSLSWVDAVIFILFGFGLVFYISRRSY
jgi:hypothetical protein